MTKNFEEIITLKDQLNLLNSNTSGLAEQIGGLEKRLDKQEKEGDSNKATINCLLKKDSQIEEKVSKPRKLIQDLEKNLSSARKSINDLEQYGRRIIWEL